MGKNFDPARVLGHWVERDLSAAAAAGELSRAFGTDTAIRRLSEAIAAGRHLVLTGPPGVGKTALIHELARRNAAGEPGIFGGRRVLQISFRARATAMSKPGQFPREVEKLVKALLASSDVVPYFRDFHYLGTQDLTAQMTRLAVLTTAPLLAEAEESALHTLFESEPGLASEYSTASITAPKPSQLQAMVAAWAEDRRAVGLSYDFEALATALELSDRLLLGRVRQPRAVFDLLKQAMPGDGNRVTSAAVVTALAEGYRIPRLFIDPEYVFDYGALGDCLRAAVIEQDEAVDAVMRMMVRVRAGLSDPRRPFGVFLFVGPSGVGKTLVAQALARELFGSVDRLVRINMADYSDHWNDSELFGSANGDTLAERRGVLTTRLQGHTVAVLLLDEFEKAHSDVHDRFLQFVDEGAFINGAGETVSARSLIVIATSNAGAEVYRTGPMGLGSALDDAVREAQHRVKSHFRFELLNRFDEIIHFRPLTPAGVRQIASGEVEGIARRSGIRQRGLSLQLEDGVLDWLAEEGYDSRFGARYLRRAVERHVATAVAEHLVRMPPDDGGCIRLSLEGDRLTARG